MIGISWAMTVTSLYLSTLEPHPVHRSSALPTVSCAVSKPFMQWRMQRQGPKRYKQKFNGTGHHETFSLRCSGRPTVHKTKAKPPLAMLQYKSTPLTTNIVYPGPHTQTHRHTHTHIVWGLHPETSALQALFNHVGLAALMNDYVNKIIKII